ncbi:MAG: hypothetical protein ACXU9C_07340 [Xanthobacteraceae bacterium]
MKEEATAEATLHRDKIEAVAALALSDARFRYAVLRKYRRGCGQQHLVNLDGEHARAQNEKPAEGIPSAGHSVYRQSEFGR